jgi:hypothetical protein
MQQIKANITPGSVAHLVAFNVTGLEEKLALELSIPVYGCPSKYYYWGTKSGSREIFKKAGIPVPVGMENLRSVEEILTALNQLKQQKPQLKRAVVKLNDGFSGDGNAIYIYEEGQAVNLDNLHQGLQVVAKDMPYEVFLYKFTMMGGVVEEFIEGDLKNSPSVQCRINPLREIDVISTHDQVLGGEFGQIYAGATFPAHEEYRTQIGHLGYDAARVMESMGILGRFGIDFISVKENGQWKHYAIEINLRKGGTTHPYLMLQLLTNGRYHYQKGTFEMPNGQTRCYVATDNLMSDTLKTLTPTDLIDIAICHGLHFDGSTQEGVMFHLIGAISQHGKLGLLCVASTEERAKVLYQKTVDLLHLETS